MDEEGDDGEVDDANKQNAPTAKNQGTEGGTNLLPPLTSVPSTRAVHQSPQLTSSPYPGVSTLSSLHSLLFKYRNHDIFKNLQMQGVPVLAGTGMPYAAAPTTAVSPGMGAGKFPPSSAPIAGAGYQQVF
jgi:hypothetical protein